MVGQQKHRRTMPARRRGGECCREWNGMVSGLACSLYLVLCAVIIIIILHIYGAFVLLAFSLCPHASLGSLLRERGRTDERSGEITCTLLRHHSAAQLRRLASGIGIATGLCDCSSLVLLLLLLYSRGWLMHLIKFCERNKLNRKVSTFQ